MLRSLSLFLLTLVCLGTVSAKAQTANTPVTIVVSRVEAAYHVVDTIVVDVTVTNESKMEVLFHDSARNGWFSSLYKTEGATKDHTAPALANDLLEARRKRNLARLPPSEDNIDDLGSYAEIKPGESTTFRVPISTADLALTPGDYTVVVHREDLKAQTTLTTPPFVLTLLPDSRRKL